MKNIYLQLLDIKPDLPQVVLATVTRTSGSTPGKPGSSVIFGKSGLVAGTIGGGATEGKIREIARDVIGSAKSGLFHFDLDNDPVSTGDPICGGQISVLVDGSPYEQIPVFDQIRESLLKRIPGILITVASGKENELNIKRYWVTSEKMALPILPGEKAADEVKALLSSGNSTDFRELDFTSPESEDKLIAFLEPLFPQPHLVIAGAGHIGKALAMLGKFLGFEVTVIDDRPEFASHVNIPDADNIIVDNIGKTIEGIRKTRDTYVVIVTRGHKDDADALRPCFGTSLAYIGMIGSRKKTALMRETFITNGWATPQQWDRIYSPVGLDIKSKTVAEIAVSIAAQLVLVRNNLAGNG